MKLNDDSPMPWGKFKGKKMIDVPADYLLWLRDREDKISGDVSDYIDDNYSVLLLEAKRQ
jgi:uncharacterized protein (DUF3820 family)